MCGYDKLPQVQLIRRLRAYFPYSTTIGTAFEVIQGGERSIATTFIFIFTLWFRFFTAQVAVENGRRELRAGTLYLRVAWLLAHS